MELRWLGVLAVALAVRVAAQPTQPQLLLRLDDVGLNHSVNDAVRRVAEAGLVFSASVLVVAPSYRYAEMGFWHLAKIVERLQHA